MPSAPGTLVFSHANGFPAGTYRVLFDAWREGGTEAVEALLDPPAADETDNGRIGTDGVRRVLVHSTGFAMSPYADIKPAGGQAPRKLWHSSPGSSGR